MSLRLFGSSVPSFPLTCFSEMSMGFTLPVNKIYTEKYGPQLMPENLLEGGKKELFFSRVAIEFWNRHLWRLFSSTYFRNMSLPAPFLTRAFMPGGGGLAEWPVQSSTQPLLCLSSRSFCFPLLPSSLSPSSSYHFWHTRMGDFCTLVEETRRFLCWISLRQIFSCSSPPGGQQ